METYFALRKNGRYEFFQKGRELQPNAHYSECRPLCTPLGELCAEMMLLDYSSTNAMNIS